MKNQHLFRLSTKDICLFVLLARPEFCFQLYLWIYCLALGEILLFPSLLFLCLFILFNYKQGRSCLSLCALVPRSSEALISKARAFRYFPNIKYLPLAARVSLAQFYSLLKPSRWEREKMVSSKSCTINVISLSALLFLLFSDPILMSSAPHNF